MDNFKVIYKILRSLEKNMGNDEFDIKSVSAERMNISFERWEQFLIMMQVEGYIKGLTSGLSSTYRHITEPIRPQITIKGLEYLAENSLMRKAKEALKMAGEIL